MTDNITIASLNVRGLSNTNDRNVTFHQLKNNNYNIIFLQETHANATDAAAYARLWYRPSSWAPSPTPASCGVAILLGKSFAQDTPLHDIVRSPDGRYIAVTINIAATGDPQRLLRLHNLYAPASSGPERRTYFDEIYTNYIQLHHADEHVLGGDFNCVDNVHLDKVGGNPNHGTDGAAQLRTITASLDLVDVWRNQHPHERATTWRNGNVGTRLDRLYLPRALLPSCSSTISPFPLSDHDLVSVTIDLSAVQRGKGYWKLNTAFLRDPIFVGRIKGTIAHWRQHAYSNGQLVDPDLWNDLKVDIKRECITYAQGVATAQGEHRLLLQERYSDALDHWMTNPDATNTAQLATARAALNDLDHDEFAAAAVRSRAAWLTLGERPTRFFCQLERDRSNASTIKALQHPTTGMLCSTPRDLCDAASAFYSTLYAPDQPDDPAATAALCAHVPRLHDRPAQRCDAPLSLNELTTAVKSTANGKTPGLDGLPKEFYSTFWDVLGPVLLDVLNASLRNGRLPTSCRQGVLCLLHKKGDPTLLKNKRPLTMITADTKILAKALALRLDRVIHDLVHPDQTGFIKGRVIHDNVLLYRGIAGYLQRQQQPGAVLFLDQEKAFDRVSWAYRDHVLSAMGFGPRFCSMVSLLHANISASVLVNGHISRPFPVLRGTRQGDPLSPGLYALLDEPLACAARASPLYRGILLPETFYGRRAKISQYADDKAVYLNSPTDYTAFNDILDLVLMHLETSARETTLEGQPARGHSQS